MAFKIHDSWLIQFNDLDNLASSSVALIFKLHISFGYEQSF